jgi:hypothetical protein
MSMSPTVTRPAALCAFLALGALATLGVACDKKKSAAPEFKGTGKGAAASGAATADGGKAPAGPAGKSVAVQPAAAADFKGPGAHLPHPEAAAGWKQSGKVRYYKKDNLFELINGAAEQYLEYGFKELATADYVSPEAGAGKTITVEIYEMNDALGAFGLFSRQTGEAAAHKEAAAGKGKGEAKGGDGDAAEPEDLERARAQLGDGQILLFKASYFVRVNWLDESAKADKASAKSATQQHLRPVAAAVARKIPGDSKDPQVLVALTSDGRMAGRTIYYPKQAPDYGVGPAFTLSYDQEKNRYDVLVIEGAEPAKAAIRTLRTKLIGAQPVAKLGEEAVAGTLLDLGGHTLVARDAAHLVLVHDVKGTEPSQRLKPDAKEAWVRQALEDLKSPK